MQNNKNQNERPLNEIHETCSKVCKILELTGDGDMLDPRDLKLIDSAVNGYLNENGKQFFDCLYTTVAVDKTYIKPYLHGIKHITYDSDGYIYYKNIRVEHYDRDYAYSECAKNDLIELKRRCEFLERKNIPVNGKMIWKWDKYNDEYSSGYIKTLNILLGNEVNGLQYSKVEIRNSGRVYKYFTCGTPTLDEIKNHPVTVSMIGRYFHNEYYIKVEQYIYTKRRYENFVPLGEIKTRDEIESLLMSCHDYLEKYDKLDVQPVITHKTDFAEGYDKTKIFDNVLNSPGRSLQYTIVEFFYGYKLEETILIAGNLTPDEIKTLHEYKSVEELYGGGIKAYFTTFLYGKGEPLDRSELRDISKIESMLTYIHPYLVTHDLSDKIGWRDYRREQEAV